MTTGWKKIKSKIVHKNSWFSIYKDDVINPNGKPGKYYYSHGHDAIAVIAEDKNNNLYLVGQTRYPIGNQYSWEVIGGGIEKGETLLAAAKRELKEETGLEASK